jgi:transmembrane sensor
MNKNLKKLAYRYFEGRLSPDAERELYEFITANEANAALFRTWEQEWKKEHVLSFGEMTLLNSLRSKMRKQDYMSRIRSLRIRFAAAAAVLMFVSAFATWYFVQYRTPEQLFSVEVPLGTNSRISLPDSTLVWLNAGSTLTYSSEFNKSSRDITLSGEAYFEVAKNPGLPFKVATRNCTFTVLGTKFNITAYESDPNVLAALMEGSLRFESEREEDTMVPGDLITYDCKTRFARREQVDVEQFRAWTQGAIRYDATTLPILFKRLAREYNVQIELRTSAFDDRVFRVSLNNAENIDTIMGALCEILPISVERRGKQFYVDRKTDGR